MFKSFFAYIYFLYFFPLCVFAYVDSDMDGVADKDDACPNTPITELTDLSGCAIKSLLSPHHFSLGINMNSAKEENQSYAFSNIEFNYSYKHFALQLATALSDLKEHKLSQEGINYSYLNLFYHVQPFEPFSLVLGSGLSFSVKTQEVIDYHFSLYGKYRIQKYRFALGFGYNKTLEKESINTRFYDVNIGYTFGKNTYTSLGYNILESMYKDVENFETLSIYHRYEVNKHWFVSVQLSQGLSASSLDNSIGVQCAYHW